MIQMFQTCGMLELWLKPCDGQPPALLYSETAQITASSTVAAAVPIACFRKRRFASIRSSASLRRPSLSSSGGTTTSGASPLRSVSSSCVGIATPPFRRLLLVAERLGGIDAGGEARGDERRRERDEIDADEDHAEGEPRDDHAQRHAGASRIRPGRRVDDVVRDEQAEAGADEDRRERDEGRLEEQAGLHHPALEADRAQDA